MVEMLIDFIHQNTLAALFNEYVNKIIEHQNNIFIKELHKEIWNRIFDALFIYNLVFAIAYKIYLLAYVTMSYRLFITHVYIVSLWRKNN